MDCMILHDCGGGVISCSQGERGQSNEKQPISLVFPPSTLCFLSTCFLSQILTQMIIGLWCIFNVQLIKSRPACHHLCLRCSDWVCILRDDSVHVQICINPVYVRVCVHVFMRYLVTGSQFVLIFPAPIHRPSRRPNGKHTELSSKKSAGEFSCPLLLKVCC